MFEHLEPLGGDWWIGLTDSVEEGNFVWQHSGLPLQDFSPWSAGHPLANSSTNCVSLTEEHYYFWTDDNCDNMRKPVCWSPVQVNRCSLPDSSYVASLDRCYAFSEVYYNFGDSKTWCESLGKGVTMVRVMENKF
jgi:hypothetical protein